MENIPIMPVENFRAIKAWFAGTDGAEIANKLECIAVKKTFVEVVNFISDGRDHYFVVPEKLIKGIEGSSFRQTPITPGEAAFLDCIKSQLDGRIQHVIEISAQGGESLLKISETVPGYIRCFEVPSSLDLVGFKRFVIESKESITR